MKAEELKTKTYDELSKMLIDLKKQQFNLRFQRSQGQLENTGQIRVMRRDIARVKTFVTKLRGGNEIVTAAPKKATTKKPSAAKKTTTAKTTTKKATTKKKAPATKKATKDGDKAA